MLEKLYKPRYTGPLAGLEEVLPKFRHASVVQCSGKKGRGGSRRRASRYGSPLQKKLEAWQRRRRSP